jgi:hypothetical protein
MNDSNPTDEMKVQTLQDRLGIASLLIVLGGAGAVLLYIALGFTDPHPLGDLLIDETFDSGDYLFTAPREGGLMYPGEGEFLLGSDEANTLNLLIVMQDSRLDPHQAVERPGTIEISIRQREGPADAGYGVYFLLAGGLPCYYGLSSTGYAGIRLTDRATKDDFFPWTPYPHARDFGEVNRLRADFIPETITFWMNNEKVATLDNPGEGLPAFYGVYVESYFNPGALIAVERVQVWAESY